MLFTELKIRIIVPMPSDVTMSCGTKRSIDNLINAHKEIEFELFPVYGSVIASNRITGINYPPLNGKDNNGIDYFDKFLCVDNRKIFSVKDFELLINSNKPVVFGGYLIANKYASFFEYDKNEKEVYSDNLVKEDIIIECGYSGTGFYLVDSSVFKKFRDSGIVDYYYYPKKCGRFVGEDVGFCENLKLINEKIYINKNVFVEREPLPFLKERRFMKVIDIVNLGNVVSVMKKWKEVDWKFSVFLHNIWVKIKQHYEDVGEFEKALAERQQELILRHCTKDKEDKPIVTEQGYLGLMYGQCPEYDTAIKGITEEKKKYLQSEIEIDTSGWKKIEWAKVPYKNKEWDTSIMEVLLPYIDGIEGIE